MQQLDHEYGNRPWIHSLTAYCDKMEGMSLTKLQFGEIFFFTDATEVSHMKAEFALNSFKLGIYDLENPRKDLKFLTNDHEITREAKEQHALPVPQNLGFWYESFVRPNGYKYEQRMRTFEDQVVYIRCNRERLISESDAHEALLAKAEKMRAKVLHASYFYHFKGKAKSNAFPLTLFFSTKKLLLEMHSVGRC